ncbi:MAG TPA: phasin family protein [Candidatus Sulfotelmatobacter sp.]|jgi:phasin family protein|nr:phasin family protein [Candidatus Sulfotelmatobacter sp.]
MTTAKTAKPTPTPAADAVKQIEEVVAVHKETIESVVKAGADVASKGVDKAVSLTKEHVDAAAKAHSAAFQGYEDILSFSKDNIDALVKSSSILARGLQDLSKSLVTLTQAQIDESVAASKALASAKTLREVIDLSSSLTKTNFDKLVAEGTKLQQLTAKLAEEAAAPIASRVEATVARVTKNAA